MYIYVFIPHRCYKKELGKTKKIICIISKCYLHDRPIDNLIDYALCL